MLPSMGSQRAGHDLTTEQQPFHRCVVGSLWLTEVTTYTRANGRHFTQQEVGALPLFPSP